MRANIATERMGRRYRPSLVLIFVSLSTIVSLVPTASSSTIFGNQPVQLRGHDTSYPARARGGLNQEELKKFGSMISDVSEDDCEIPTKLGSEHPEIESDTCTNLGKPSADSFKVELKKVEVNSFQGPRVEFSWRPNKDQQNRFKRVTMCGSWTSWQEHYNLTRAADADPESEVLSCVVEHIPDGEHHFKFIVDDQWTVNDAYTISKDASGNTNNVMRIYSNADKAANAAGKSNGVGSLGLDGARAAGEEPRPYKAWWLRLLLKFFMFWKK